MADRYIDPEEIRHYGPFACEMIRKYVAGLLPPMTPAALYLADELERHTDEVVPVFDQARQLSAQVRVGRHDKQPVLGEAISFLGRFSKHLATHKPEVGLDRRTFFVEDGTARGVGRSAPRILLTVRRIATQLLQEGCRVQHAATWQAEAEDLAARLAPLVEHSQSVRADRQMHTPAVEQARAAWLATYTATKCGVECILRLTGRLRLMPVIFYDLAVPASTEVTAPIPIPTEPIEPDEPGDGEGVDGNG